MCGALLEEMKEIEKELPGYQFLPTLSREDWHGHKGYVHPIYERLCEARQPAVFMLCGWRDMIDQAKDNIIKMGYISKDVHVEIYG